MIAGRLVDAENLLYAVVKAMDNIERNEAGNGSLAPSVGLVLKAAGYPEIDCFAAATLIAKDIETSFSDRLWRTRGPVERVALFFGVCKSAMDLIEEGKISEAIRHRTAEILEETKRRKPGATD